jgi:hypothetical protein
VHFEATPAVIAEYLEPFTIVDQIRGFNPRKQTNSTVHVLFAIDQEKVAACREIASGKLMGRDVALTPAPAGIYTRKSGLLSISLLY